MLYDCKSRNDGVPYRVELIHNEREFNISDVFQECKGEHYCDYRNFKKIYQDQALQCDFEKLCDIAPATPSSVNGIQGTPATSSSDFPYITVGVLSALGALVVGVVLGFIVGNLRGKKSAQETYYNLNDADMTSYRQMGSDLARPATVDSARVATKPTELE